VSLDRTQIYSNEAGDLAVWSEDDHAWEVLSSEGNVRGVYYTDEAMLTDFPDLTV
jgi:Zn-dependent oligopeptidase